MGMAVAEDSSGDNVKGRYGGNSGAMVRIKGSD